MSQSLKLRPAPPAGGVSTAHATAPPAEKALARARVTSIDLLRGLVMVLMALDHTRDFFASGGFNPRDVTAPGLFLTRWITHLCAPTFIFLAGLSAYLYGARGKSTGEVSRFLLTRGFWLMLLEFTVVRLAWTFSLEFNAFVAQVIWAIGASMVVLAVLVHLPRWAVAAVALAIIAGHNLLDGIKAQDLGSLGGVWTVLHQPGTLRPIADVSIFILYPLIPWFAVMAAGYALGPIFQADASARRRFLLSLGAGLTLGFVVLRATNLYGDPASWADQGSWLPTLLSFINCEKYPPSLLFLLMTLGPALMLLALFEGARGRLANWVTTFGRVPLFYYVVHLFWIHVLAGAYALWLFGDTLWALLGAGPPAKPAGYGLSLLGVYGVWLFVVVTLYPLCRWFADLKQRRREWWWSYF